MTRRQGRTWPLDGDSPLIIARKVAIAYRHRLGQEAPDACDQIDTLMRDLGQAWVMPRIVRVEPEDWLSVQEAADLACLHPDTISRLRRRQRLRGKQDANGTWFYLAREIMALSAKRTRYRADQ